jgi:hypothetical protein
MALKGPAMAKRKKHRASKSLRDDFNTLQALEQDLESLREP